MTASITNCPALDALVRVVVDESIWSICGRNSARLTRSPCSPRCQRGAQRRRRTRQPTYRSGSSSRKYGKSLEYSVPSPFVVERGEDRLATSSRRRLRSRAPPPGGGSARGSARAGSARRRRAGRRARPSLALASGSNVARPSSMSPPTGSRSTDVAKSSTGSTRVLGPSLRRPRGGSDGVAPHLARHHREVVRSERVARQVPHGGARLRAPSSRSATGAEQRNDGLGPRRHVGRKCHHGDGCCGVGDKELGQRVEGVRPGARRVPRGRTPAGHR